jgi:hypothetical protein
VSKQLFIIAACAERKRQSPAPHLQLRGVPKGDVEKRVHLWIERLEAARNVLHSARDLYIGPWWANVLELSELAARKYEANLYVASAGYGLVHSDCRIASYSATFARGGEDSVAHSEAGRTSDGVHERWWQRLGEWKGSGSSFPRTIAELASEHPKSAIVMLGSPEYVRALSNDLCKAREKLSDPDHLVIITSALEGPATNLRENAVCSEARLLHKVGGSRLTLHARVATALLLRSSKQTCVRASEWWSVAQQWSNDSPAPTAFNRAPASDKEVLAFIRFHLSRNSEMSHTPMLRAFRDSGSACEQGRFRQLFQQVRFPHGH